MLSHFIHIPLIAAATIKEWRKDNPSIMAAALAYYAFFSLIPLLVIISAIGSVFFGQAAVNGQLSSTLSYLFGNKIADLIQTAIAQTYGQASSTTLIIAVVVLLLGASFVFVQLRNVLNNIWGVRENRITIKNFLEGRLLSLLMVIGLAVSAVLWLALSTVLSTLSLLLRSSVNVPVFLLTLEDFIVLFVISTMLFSMIYKLLPAVKLAWSDVLLGSVVTSFLFTLGEFLLAFYFSKINLATLYGAAGSIVVLLVWLNATAHLFLFGAIFTRVYARRHGTHKKTRKSQGKRLKQQE